MITFWTLSAVMLAAALAMLAPALLRRQKNASLDRNAQNIAIARERLAELDAELAKGHIGAEEHANTKRELEQVLLQDLDAGDEQVKQAKNSVAYAKRGLLALIILVPLVSIATYQQLGNPALIDSAASSSHAPSTSNGNAPVGSMAELAVKLRQRLEENTPDDANGWYLLGRTYMTMKDYPQAAQAFEKTYRLVGEQPAIMLALADALTMSHQGDMSGRPAELVEKALQLEPQNTTALWMGGLIAEKRGDYAEALRLWGKLDPLLAGSPKDKQQLATQISRVSAKAGIEPPTMAGTAVADKAKPDAAGTGVKLNITLATALQQQVNAGDTVFVYAKAMNGPRFPLAAARYRVSDLPLTITLDDSQAVMPAAKLSDFQRVKVGARVSASGNAIAQSGDLIGEIPDIEVDGNATIDIVIDKALP